MMTLRCDAISVSIVECGLPPQAWPRYRYSLRDPDRTNRKTQSGARTVLQPSTQSVGHATYQL
jgi:hypothetical protein